MRDGTRLAVEVYLPGNLPPGQRLPVLLHQTRYWRAPDFRLPARWLHHGLIGYEGTRIRQLIHHGYAFVNVDVRGSGASFGQRPYPWHRDEVLDGVEILDWILQQPWAKPDVGLIGVSYSATAAEFLLHQHHPAVRCAALLFCLFDVYQDVAFPGGVQFSWFTQTWGEKNRQLDANKVPLKSPLLRALVRGVAPVAGAETELPAALAAHAANIELHARASALTYRDEVFDPETGVNIDVFSPHSYVKQLDEASVPLLCYSGYLDGAYTHSAIRRYLNQSHPESRLVLGPWEHRGQFNISPFGPGKSRFDHLGELLRFFDRHLGGAEGEAAPSVRYYLMGAECWETAESWPPSDAPAHRWYCQPAGQLSPEPIEAGQRPYTQVPDLGAGLRSRWRSMVSELHTPRAYPDLDRRDRQRCCFDTAPLTQPLRIIGHPQAVIYLRSTAPDGALHAYLEAVAPDGKVRYLTEGLLRWQHRARQEEAAPYQDVVPYRSFCQADARPLERGEVACLDIDLLPVAVEIPAGHRLRLALALGDADHFAELTPAGTEVVVLCGGEWGSGVRIGEGPSSKIS